MIAVEIRMSPSVFESSGEGLSVQFTKSARRPEKSHVLVAQSSSWKSVKVMRASRFDVSRTLARVKRLLEDWFAANARDLPWRQTRDPYAILVSEVMLQQTQVDRVVPRYLAWLERWPTVEALAGASTADVIREWQGLGYNRRGVALHRAARRVAALGWPDDLTELPGVGPYTAAAVRCFAHGEDVLPVDVNVERVQRRTGHSFPSSSAQALMDLGATICLARIPRCNACPLATACPSRGVREEPARKQGPFEGSFRQQRAATLRVVADASRELAELDDEAVRSLERDGLVVVQDGLVALPSTTRDSSRRSASA
jgi:A/G-specific adenine glycosylase